MGRRKAQRANRAIDRISLTRKNNKNTYDQMTKESKEIYVGKKSKKLAKALAGDKAIYDTSEVVNRHATARNKAKLDKTYKDSKEYKESKKAFNKQSTQQMLYGTMGHQKIETLKNLGYSEKKAKGKAMVDSLAVGVVISGLIAGASYLKNK